MRPVFALFFAYACVGSGVPAWADGAPDPRTTSACAVGQQLAFACSTGAGRQVAVCASSDLSPTSGALQYRFLRKGKVELTLPGPSPASADWRAQVKAGQVMYAGGGGAWIRFAADAHSYVVYSATGRGWGQKNGVMVLSPDGKQAVQRCRGPVKTLLGLKLAERAGLQADAEDLELPGP